MSKTIDWMRQHLHRDDNGAGGEIDHVSGVRGALLFFALIAVLMVFAYSFYAAALLPDKSIYLNRLLGASGTVMAVAFASFGVGGLLGFLFGIPKAVALESRTKPVTNAADVEPEEQETGLQHYRSNTNLEEISDWLTKIIVGATLIEFKEIRGFFENLITTVSVGVEPLPFATTMVGSVIIGFLVLGFFAIYLMTRLYLASAFDILENALNNAFRRQRKIQSTVNQKFDDLSDNEKRLLRVLLASEGNVLTLAPTFVRHSPDHIAWESLRDRGFVTPRGGGRWKPGSIVTLTELGKQLRERLSIAVK